MTRNLHSEPIDFMTSSGEEFDPDFLNAPNPEEAAEESFQYDEPDAKFAAKKNRSTKAKHYEKKIGNLFSFAFRTLAAHEATVSDSAAIIMHGPDIAEKAGDLAAHNMVFARAIDMITDGAENPYFNLLAASAPLVVQILRNHETATPSMAVREFRIPFTKKTFKLRFKFKLTMPPTVRNLSHDPEALNAHVFTNAKVAAMIQREGINVAWHANR